MPRLIYLRILHRLPTLVSVAYGPLYNRRKIQISQTHIGMHEPTSICIDFFTTMFAS